MIDVIEENEKTLLKLMDKNKTLFWELHFIKRKKANPLNETMFIALK
jgi:hypothetical protein